METTNSVVRTEVRGFVLRLEELQLVLSADGNGPIAAVPLQANNAQCLRMEMAKARLWEWNQFEELKSQAELRYRRYLGSWLVMCLAAFSAYLGYPSYYLCILLSMASVFLWWRTGYEAQRAEREAQAQRMAFQPEWDYIRQRLEEEDAAGA